jgi:hypothetical protein
MAHHLVGRCESGAPVPRSPATTPLRSQGFSYVKALSMQTVEAVFNAHNVWIRREAIVGLLE